MPKARVLHVLSDLSVGGGQTIVMQHLEHSDRDRFDVRVVSLGSDRTLESWFASAGAAPVVIDVEAVGRLGAARRAIPHVRDADVVHIHTDIGRDVGGAAAFWCRVPVVSHLHGEWVHLGPVHSSPEGGPVRRLRRASVRRGRVLIEHATVAHYVAGSRAVARSYESVVHRPMSVCRPSVSWDAIVGARRGCAGARLRAELGIPPRAQVILSVARMVEAKGHAELMAMFDTVGERHPDAVLVLVGDGPFRAPLLDDIANHPYGDRILAPGARQDVAAFLAMADVFVHASLTEAFGLVILEAMAAGLPVVAFELPAYADFVVAGASADLVPLSDVAALADATSALLDDPIRAARLGSFGQSLAQEHHPPDAVARSFESIYSEILSLPTRAPGLLTVV